MCGKSQVSNFRKAQQLPANSKESGFQAISLTITAVQKAK